MTPRNRFRALHRRARLEKLQPGTRELAQAVCDITGGTFGNGWNLPELRLQRAIDEALEPVADMRRELARNVLNGFGRGNAFRSPDPGPGSYCQPNAAFVAWQRVTHRADALRHRLEAACRLVTDNGGWATGEVLPAAPDRAKVAA